MTVSFLFSFHRMGDLMVDSALTVFLSTHTVMIIFTVCRKRNCPSSRRNHQSSTENLYVCWGLFHRDTPFSWRRELVNRSEESVKEVLVVETGYVASEVVNHFFTQIVVGFGVSLPCVDFKFTKVDIPRVCPYPPILWSLDSHGLVFFEARASLERIIALSILFFQCRQWLST